MTNLKYNKKVLSPESTWADSQAALLHEYTKYTVADLQKKTPRIIEYLHNPRYVLETARNYKIYSTAEKISLKQEQPELVDFDSLLKKRESCRKFSGESIELQSLSNLLGWSAKVTRKAGLENFPDESLEMRPYPSGGGLYPCEIYVVATNVSGLTIGVYHYNTKSNELEVIDQHIDINEVKSSFMAESFVDDISFIIVITSVFERSVTKYSDRGYRIALLEAGHIAQNMLLSSTLMGFGSLAWGGGYDNKISKLLKNSVINEPPVHAILVGKRNIQ